MSTVSTSGVEGSTCTMPRRLQRTDLLAFRKQSYSSMSDGGTAHNSYLNMVVSCNCRCYPTTRRRMKIVSKSNTVVPALGDPRRERPPAMYGHIINVPTHFNVKLPAISGHLPNADSQLLVVSTWNNGQCKQMPRFRWSFQPKIAGLRTSSRVINHMIAANQPLHWLRLFYDTTSEKSRLLFFQLAMSKKRTILSLDQGIEVLFRLGEAHHVERLLPSQCGKNANGTYDIKTDRDGHRDLR